MNVIVIVADSLRYDHVGCCGNTWIETPRLDALAKESMLFDNAYVEGMPTLPCRTAFFTGRFTFPFRGWEPIRPDDVLLAEMLWDQGYRTALVTDTYHMLKPGMGYGRGFEHVEFIRGQEGDPYVLDETLEIDLNRYELDPDPNLKWTQHLIQYLRNRHHWTSEDDHFVAQVMKASMRWLDTTLEQQRDKLFLWIDSFDPHEPWDPPEEYWRQYDPDYKGPDLIMPRVGKTEGYLEPHHVHHVRALYAGLVTLVDKWIGLFLDYLRDKGLLDNTLVVFTTDHGEPLGERGFIRKGCLWPYEELSHIPLIVRHPEGVGAGQRTNAFVHTCDLMPTLLDFLGTDPTNVSEYQRPANAMHGRSFLPVIRGDVKTQWPYGLSCARNQMWSIRDHEYTCMFWANDANDGTVFTEFPVRKVHELELYHRPSDPEEKRNLAVEQADRAREMELTARRLAACLT